jgi:hypothetical protein
MAPKKKGKGNKLSRMTEEERARYLQHRAAIEEEARRRKQQLIAAFMKVRLRNIFSYLEFWMVDNFQKPSDSECYPPSPESFRI